MLDFLQIAFGSVVGKDHIATGKCLIGRNNQDAFMVRRTSDLIVAIVCDGCGSGKHSEVGAWFAVNALSIGIQSRLSAYPNQSNPASCLDRVRKDVLAQMRNMANSFGGSLSEIVNDYFLFTTVGIIITSQKTQIFAIGDGVYATSDTRKHSTTSCVDSEMSTTALTSLGPFPGNAPPYMAYDLVESSIDPSLLNFKVVHEIPTADMVSVLIGSDGMEDFERLETHCIPGTTEEIGSWQQFWDNNLFFTNPDALGRKLRRINSEVVRIDKETGRKKVFPRLLPDDTTIISIRKSPEVMANLRSHSVS